MKTLRLIAVAMLVWGNFAFADLEGGQESYGELQEISSWMALLNYNYPDLNVTVSDRADLSSPETRQEILENLQDLRLRLQSNKMEIMKARPLRQIVCGKAICGD